MFKPYQSQEEPGGAESELLVKIKTIEEKLDAILNQQQVKPTTEKVKKEINLNDY